MKIRTIVDDQVLGKWNKFRNKHLVSGDFVEDSTNKLATYGVLSLFAMLASSTKYCTRIPHTVPFQNQEV